MSRASFWAARRRDERGAYAVLFALLSTVLFGLAALGVDLGNLYQRKAETQSQADLAATSAAVWLLILRPPSLHAGAARRRSAQSVEALIGGRVLSRLAPVRMLLLTLCDAAPAMGVAAPESESRRKFKSHGSDTGWFRVPTTQ